MSLITTAIDRQRRSLDVSEKIHKLEPSAAPLIVILSRLSKKPAKSAEISWYDEAPAQSWTRIDNGAGYAAGDLALVVDSVAEFGINDVIKIPRTGETMLVGNVTPATNTLTVTRSWGTTAAAAILNDDWVLRLGTAMREGSLAPAPRSNQPVRLFNFTQIFRTTLQITNTQMAEGVVTSETERQRLSARKGVEHRKAMEYATLFGERREDTVTVAGEVRRSMGGINEFIITNRYDHMNANILQAQFDAALEPMFRFGSKTKTLLSGANLRRAINGWANARLETVSGADKTFGITVSRYISPYGELNIVNHPMLENFFAGWAMLLDIENMEYAPLRDTKLERNLQPNDADYILDEYITEASLRVRGERTHGILMGIAG